MYFKNLLFQLWKFEIHILPIILFKHWYNCACPLWSPHQLFNIFSVNCVSNEIFPQQHDSWLAWHTISYQIPLHCFLLTFWATCISEKNERKTVSHRLIGNEIWFFCKRNHGPNMSHKSLSYSFLIIYISSIFPHSKMMKKHLMKYLQNATNS